MRPVRELPHALDHLEDIVRALRGRRPAFFLDFDGTLAPIVPHPADATIADEARAAVATIAERFPVAILSGRDLLDLRARVDLDVILAGSHGFEILGPHGLAHRFADADVYLSELDALEAELRHEMSTIDGAIVDRKRYAVALHDRMADEADRPRIAAIAADAARRHPGLRGQEGRRVHEFRPAVDWDKGHALLWLLDALGLSRVDVTALYLGDDTTDEDAFRALRDARIGVGIVIGDRGRASDAHYRVDTPEEAWRLLARVADDLEADAR